MFIEDLRGVFRSSSAMRATEGDIRIRLRKIKKTRKQVNGENARARFYLPMSSNAVN